MLKLLAANEKPKMTPQGAVFARKKEVGCTESC